MMMPNEGGDVGWQIKRTNNGVGIVTTYLSISLDPSLSLSNLTESEATKILIKYSWLQ